MLDLANPGIIGGRKEFMSKHGVHKAGHASKTAIKAQEVLTSIAGVVLA